MLGKRLGILRIRYSPSAEAGVVVLSDLLVALLRSAVGSTLDRVGDVVGGVADLVHVGGWGWLVA